MLKLTTDPQVLQSLKKAMPKTNKAELALEKYVSVLTAHLDRSLLYMEDNRYRFFKQFLVSIERLMLESGQFVISGKKQYLHTWLGDNQLNLIKVVTKGLVGQEHSTISLTELVSVEDNLDLKKLGKQEINQIDQWLNDKSLSDEDLIEKVFPEIYSFEDVKEAYDPLEVDIVSLKRYITWLIKKAKHFNEVEKQRMLRQAYLILRVAEITGGLFPQEKNPSFFGRNYYHGLSVQSVHTSLREAMLGDCYEYDLRSASVSWKLSFANDLLRSKKINNRLEDEFGATLFSLEDKTAFIDYVINHTFLSSTISDEIKIDTIKTALTALGFGARMAKQGWIDQSGKSMNPALVKIIKNKDERERFIHCDLIVSFMEEQKRLDEYIYNHFTKLICPALLKEPQLQTTSGKASKNKIMAWLFQHAETHVMDMVAKEISKTKNKVIARVHDAIFVRHKISDYDKEKLERLICKRTNIPYWRLKEEQIRRYVGVSDETLQDEQLHREHIAAETELAKGYVGQFNQPS
jgi:hypothetical protein